MTANGPWVLTAPPQPGEEFDDSVLRIAWPRAAAGQLVSTAAGKNYEIAGNSPLEADLDQKPYTDSFPPELFVIGERKVMKVRQR